MQDLESQTDENVTPTNVLKSTATSPPKSNSGKRASPLEPDTECSKTKRQLVDIKMEKKQWICSKHLSWRLAIIWVNPVMDCEYLSKTDCIFIMHKHILNIGFFLGSPNYFWDNWLWRLNLSFWTLFCLSFWMGSPFQLWTLF